jgi:hypothetical protein
VRNEEKGPALRARQSRENKQENLGPVTGILLKCKFWFRSPGWGLSVYISHRFPAILGLRNLTAICGL